ncbi:RNA-directed DNA polymerase, eukaryota [Tanacetum coccineum]
MGGRRSKEDQVQQISTSIYVTNFPEYFSYRDLWKECQVYGRVIDAFIPNRRSKAGNKFGFVRFIHIKDIDRLVSNLCTIWVGRFRLHANVARFQRNPLNKKQNDNVYNEVPKIPAGVPSNSKGVFASHNSYVGAVKNKKEYKHDTEENSIPSLEGFDNFNLKYLGGFWVIIKFCNKDVLEKFKSHTGVGLWFASLEYASDSFVIDERVVWVDIEGVPMKAWTNNTFKKISAKWGELLVEEDEKNMSWYSRRLCIKTKKEQNIFETFKIIIKGRIFWIRAKEVSGWIPDFVEEEDVEDGSDEDSDESDGHAVPDTYFNQSNEASKHVTDDRIEEGEIQYDDPFNLNVLLQKKQCHISKEKEKSNTTLKYPPGFTHRKNKEQDIDKEDSSNRGASLSKEDGNESRCSGRFRRTEEPRTGGSILKLLEDVVKVGQTMGLEMDGCASPRRLKKWVKELCSQNKVNFMSLQETKMETVDNFCIKNCWGNLSFESEFSASVGYSGGILCIWDPSVFRKYNSTISDYFVAIQGEWIPNVNKYLIIFVYAPQEFSEKKMYVIPFHTFHYWFEWEGFDQFVVDTWNTISISDNNGIIKFMKKMRFLKGQIRRWVKNKKETVGLKKSNLKGMLNEIDVLIDDKKVDQELLNKRVNVSNSLQELEKLEAIEIAQKVKIKWSIEGDENSKFFHGMLNKKRNQQTICGILKDGTWVDDPNLVKNEFFTHFRERFDQPCSSRLLLETDFPNRINVEQNLILERPVSKEEVKRAIWDCGIDKSPGPDGFTFGFCRRY